LCAFILAESFGLTAVGYLLGAGGAWLLYTSVDAPSLTGGMFPLLDVTPRILGTASLVAVGLGLISSAAPAVSVARLTVAEGLKTID
jgi:ABC-type antimicrobial peptide transport system permease subunit